MRTNSSELRPHDVSTHCLIDVLLDGAHESYSVFWALKAIGLLAVITEAQQHNLVTHSRLAKLLGASRSGLSHCLAYLDRLRILHTQRMHLPGCLAPTQVYSVPIMARWHDDHGSPLTESAEHAQAANLSTPALAYRYAELHATFLRDRSSGVSWQVFLKAIALFHVVLRSLATINVATKAILARQLGVTENSLTRPLIYLQNAGHISLRRERISGQIGIECQIDISPAEVEYAARVLSSLREILRRGNHQGSLALRDQCDRELHRSLRRGPFLVNSASGSDLAAPLYDKGR
ncbi:hypothetical protein [Bradyrhizobium diazoefficiens]